MNVKEHPGCHGPSSHCWYCEDCTPRDGTRRKNLVHDLGYGHSLSHWKCRESAERQCACDKLTDELRLKYNLPIQKEN